MRVLDLFCGTKSFSQAFADRGHAVDTLDIEAKFKPTFCKDIMTVSARDFLSRYDVVLESPPCTCFSVASISTHWKGGSGAYIPKTAEARKSIALVKHTIRLTLDLNPRFFIMENPRGVLRKIIGRPIGTVTYCQYGDKRMKPTDLWGRIPEGFTFRRCHNGDSCHEKAPRGSKTGTQGLKNAVFRAMMPYQLSLELCLACESALGIREEEICVKERAS